MRQWNRLSRGLLGIIPAGLLTASLATSINSALSNDWAHHSEYNGDIDNPSITSNVTRSLFGKCVTNSTTTVCERSSTPGAICIPDYSLLVVESDDVNFCDQLALSGQLLIAGATLIGVGMCLAWGLAILGFVVRSRSRGGSKSMQANAVLASRVVTESKDLTTEMRPRRKPHHPPAHSPERTRQYKNKRRSRAVLRFIIHLASLISICGTVALALSSLIGGNLLVNMAPANKNPERDTKASIWSVWTAGQGWRAATVSWITGAVACWFLDAVWRGNARKENSKGGGDEAESEEESQGEHSRESGI